MTGAGRRVQLPLIRVGGWRSRAACTERVAERLWDDRLDDPETDKQRDQRHTQAKAVCNLQCPVRQQCSDEVNVKVDEGIRGGHLLPPLHGQHTPEEAKLHELLRKGWPLDQAAPAVARLFSGEKAS